MLNCVRFAQLTFMETYFREAYDSSLGWHVFYRHEMIQMRHFLSSREHFQDEVVEALESYKEGDFEVAVRILEKDLLKRKESI